MMKNAFITVGLALLVACSPSGKGPTVGSGQPVTEPPSPTELPSPTLHKTAAGHGGKFSALVGAGEAGSFIWRCTNSGAIIMLTLPHPSATDKVHVFNGQRLVLRRLLQPGHSVSVRLPNSGNQRWLIEQATEPLTLAVNVLIKPKRVNGYGCLTYLPPTVRLKSVSHSH